MQLKTQFKTVGRTARLKEHNSCPLKKILKTL